MQDFAEIAWGETSCACGVQPIKDIFQLDDVSLSETPDRKLLGVEAFGLVPLLAKLDLGLAVHLEQGGLFDPAFLVDTDLGREYVCLRVLAELGGFPALAGVGFPIRHPGIHGSPPHH